MRLALLFVGQQLLWKPVQADWRQNPASWHGTYRGAIGSSGPFRIETRAEARAARASAPAGLGEVMEANVQLLLAVGAFCVFSARAGGGGRGSQRRVAALGGPGRRHLAPTRVTVIGADESRSLRD